MGSILPVALLFVSLPAGDDASVMPDTASLEASGSAAARLRPDEGVPLPLPDVATAGSTPPADTLFRLGENHGRIDGGDAPVRGTVLRGFGWSVVAGPVGGIFAAWRSSSRDYPVPPERASDLEELDSSYREGYRSAFSRVFDPRRREASIVGSMLGSLIWSYAVIRVVDLPNRRRVEGEFPEGDPTFSVSIPARSVMP